MIRPARPSSKNEDSASQQAVWRRRIVTELLAPRFAADPRCQALLLVGSVAGGHADAFSDLDLVAYWTTAPQMETRRAFCDALDGQGFAADDTDLRDPDLALQSRAECWYLGGDARSGLKVDITHKLCISMDKLVKDVTEQQQKHAVKLAILGSVVEACPVHDRGNAAEWQAKIGLMPKPIARKVVEENLGLFAVWTLQMLGERSDVVMYRDVVLKNVKRILGMLVGLNLRYPPLSYKHLLALSASLEHQPAALVGRIDELLRAEPIDAQALTLSLAFDTYDLIDQHMPQVDTRLARARLSYRRAQISEAPPGFGLDEG
jgi:hypothetical protein